MPPAKKRRVAAEIAAAKNTLAQQDQNTPNETTTDITDDDPSHPIDPITSDLQRMHRETTDALLNDLKSPQKHRIGKRTRGPRPNRLHRALHTQTIAASNHPTNRTASCRHRQARTGKGRIL
ncbi:hypothetical protein HJC23_004392 [Cyclotella cryptica]|uniref:Uncharacterized protein n=1 Tax=Cyclotella cryptica TaxID=29204 RepID=A0ABD3PI14_9STRA